MNVTRVLLRLRALGGLSVESLETELGPAAEQRKTLGLLALLAAAGSRGMSRDRLVAYLWPESPADKASHRLTQLLYLLRRDLGADELFVGSLDLRLNPAVIDSDVAEFTAALEVGDFAHAAEAYGGPFLDGFYLSDAAEFERWVDDERARLAQRWTTVLERLAQEATRRRDIAAAAGWWRQLSQTDPLNQGHAVNYLEALAAMGDRAGALRFIRAYEALLRAEYGTDPDRAFMDAAERLRSGPTETAPRSATPPPAIAVIPFVNLTPDRENEYFSDGMTDEIIAALARIPGIRVASRTSTFALKGKDLDAREIAERLGVSVLLEGTVRKVGNRIRLGARLINAADDCQLWAETYERTLEDVFALQEELSRAVVEALPLSRTTRPSGRVTRPTPAPEAFTLLLRGRYAARKRTVEAMSLAIEYFEQAIELDPGYALAHAGLGECWAMRGFAEFGDLPPMVAMPRAKAAVMEALRLDPRLADAHTQLAIIHLLFDWDWSAADQEFRRAIQLEPESYYAHLWYAMFVGVMGQSEESLRRARYAETLEPLSLQSGIVVGRCYYFARRYDEAIRQFTELLRIEPGHSLTTIWLVRALCAAERYGEALAEADKADPERRVPYLSGLAARSLAGLGRYDEARNLCLALERELTGHDGGISYILSAVYVVLGDLEAAIDMLEAALQARSGFLPFVLTEPTHDRLHGHPRFQALLEELSFPAAVSHRP
jgi:TolB-like protein